MPYQQYAEFFSPEELKTLSAVFDATWKELSADRPDLGTEEKVALMKKKLLHRILVSATAGGVKDSEKLKGRRCGAWVASFVWVKVKSSRQKLLRLFSRSGVLPRSAQDFTPWPRPRVACRFR
jgi:hypothetical protein